MGRNLALVASLVVLAGCALPARTLHQAAKQEVYSTATCPNVDVSHVPTSDVASRREDVYMAEGCGMRWRMTCESQRVTICPRRSRRNCHEEVQWSCAHIQSDMDDTDDELRARISRPDDGFLDHS